MARQNGKEAFALTMKKINASSQVSLVVLLMLSLSSVSYSAEKHYKTKTAFICGGTKIDIVTEYQKYSKYGGPDCEEQKLTFKNINTGKTIIIPPSGSPYDKNLDTCATYYQFFKGKEAFYLILSYNTGGNCEECIWQGILDLQGNRIDVDMNKKQKKTFSRKLKELGLPSSAELGNIDFEVIPKELEKQK